MKTYKVTIEQELSKDENNLIRSISINVNDYINLDYLLNRVNTLNVSAGNLLKIGRGGSHIWLSRQDNERIGIITHS